MMLLNIYIMTFSDGSGTSDAEQLQMSVFV